jgi:hypothetical protein
MGTARVFDESRRCKFLSIYTGLGSGSQYARSALALVPYWHYVKDILIPQIETAKIKLAITPWNAQPLTAGAKAILKVTWS